MIKRGGYGKKVLYRLGLWPKLPKKNSDCTRVWIQAVSVGELSSIHSLLESFFSNPKIEVVLSGTTSTGQRIAGQKYSAKVLAYGPFPLDWLPFSFLSWSRIQPDLALCVDSELWPEHMNQAKRRSIPFCIINARLSDRSFARLRSLNILKSLLIPDNLNVLASSEKQLERWTQIGLPHSRATNTGNLKIDISPLNPLDSSKVTERKIELGFPPHSVVVAGISTWPGEEKFLLEVLKEIRESNIDARLLLVPRHAERRNEIVNTLASFSFSFQQRTRPLKQNSDTIVHLADTTGELVSLIESADIAFLGKTIPPRCEGQNPIEPVSMGLPLIIGPACTNFKETCQELIEYGAAKQGNSLPEIKRLIHTLMQNKEDRIQMRKAGLKWRKYQGSPTQKTKQEIDNLISANRLAA